MRQRVDVKAVGDNDLAGVPELLCRLGAFGNTGYVVQLARNHQHRESGRIGCSRSQREGGSLRPRGNQRQRRRPRARRRPLHTLINIGIVERHAPILTAAEAVDHRQ